jgi:hypothetical protein
MSGNCAIARFLGETGRDATNDETYSISLIESERDVNYKNVIPSGNAGLTGRFRSRRRRFIG